MRPPTPNDSTHYACPSSEPCASSAATSPGRRVFPPDRLATNLRHALAEILARPNPARRLRTYPRVTKRASGTKFPRKRLDHTTSGTDRHPKADSPACKVNGIGMKPGMVQTRRMRIPQHRKLRPPDTIPLHRQQR